VSTVVATIAVLAAVAAVLSPPRPSGGPVADAVERALVAIVVVLAATRSRRWTLVVGAGVAAVLGTAVGLVAGCAALAVLAYLVVQRRRDRRIAAAVGALVVVGVMHLDTGLPLGVPTAAGVLVCAAVLVSGYRRSTEATRTWWRRAATAALVVGAAGVIAASAAVAVGRDRLAVATAAAQRGIEAARGGESGRAARSLGLAARRFDDLDAIVGGPWAAPATWVPVVGQNLRMVQAATESGRDLADLATTGLTRVDYQRLRRAGGGIELASAAALRGPVHQVLDGLHRTTDLIEDRRSPWLLPPLRDKVDALRSKVADLTGETRIAAAALDGAPRLLGGITPRRYLVLLGNPAELRDLGGHIGNWAELEVADGAFHLGEVGTPDELAGPAGLEPLADAKPALPPSLLDMRPSRFPQNWSSSPDLPTVTRVASELFEQRTGRTVDGVLYADPEAFAAFLSLTGPVPLRGTDRTIDASNAVAFLTRDQYVLFPNDAAANDAVTGLVRDVFDRLTRTRLPGPRELADRFAPLVHEGRLQLATTHAEDTRLLDLLDLRGAVPTPGRHDLLGIVSRNANPSKIDAYLHRSTTVRIHWDPRTGEVGSTVRVTLENRAPAQGASRTVTGNALGLPDGTNVTDLAVLTPFELLRASVDGVPTAATPQWDGRTWRHSVRLTIPPGGRQTVQFDLDGEVRAGPTYDLTVVGQPLLDPGHIRVRVTRPGGSARDHVVGERTTSEARDARLHFDITDP
jgi:hypothetical protein